MKEVPLIIVRDRVSIKITDTVHSYKHPLIYIYMYIRGISNYEVSHITSGGFPRCQWLREVLVWAKQIVTRQKFFIKLFVKLRGSTWQPYILVGGVGRGMCGKVALVLS